ncbi:MAG TPA: PRC-barrel domain-containing protein [Pirellulales bacterium]|nr:PRC-barrel domain-containing protein [Pirellulales bacterium]
MRVHFATSVAVFFGVFGWLAIAGAADKPANDSGDKAATTTRDRDDADRDHKIDKKTEGTALRVTQVRGMTVRNESGKDLGEIKDLMLDMGGHGHGHVRYAALSFGGFLGMGDKLFAVPWRALEFRHDADKNKSFVVFDVSEEKLKKAPGFDKNHWPDAADRTWMEDVDKHYGVDVRAGDTEVTVRTERRNDQTAQRTEDRTERSDVRNIDPKKGHHEHNWRLHRASEAVGMHVRNGNGDKLGKVEDIVIAMNSGNIRYLALSFGGFLGIGDKFFAVPFDAVMLQYDAKDKDFFVMFDVTKDQLDNAPGFHKDHWPDFGNEKWASEVHSYYQAHRREAKTTTRRTRVE